MGPAGPRSPGCCTPETLLAASHPALLPCLSAPSPFPQSRDRDGCTSEGHCGDTCVYGVPSFLHLANAFASLKLSSGFGWGLCAPAYPGHTCDIAPKVMCPPGVKLSLQELIYSLYLQHLAPALREKLRNVSE